MRFLSGRTAVRGIGISGISGAILLFVLLFAPASGQFPVEVASPHADEIGRFGESADAIPGGVGGRPAFVVGARREDNDGLDRSGRAYIVDAITGEIIHTLRSPNPQAGGHFGYALAGVPDADGDGDGDVVVGSREDAACSQLGAGRVYLFSGRCGRLLWQYSSPNPEPVGEFGSVVAGISDVDGGGGGDIVVGSSWEDVTPPVGGSVVSAGRVYIFSGENGGLIRTIESPDPIQWGLFGMGLSGVPDLSGDGIADLVIGEENAIRTFDSQSGQLLKTILPAPPDPILYFFPAGLRGIPDVTGDGLGDFVSYYWRVYPDCPDGPLTANSERISRTGNFPDPPAKALVYDGVAGTVWRELIEPGPEPFGFALMLSAALVPDLDGDGGMEVAIGLMVNKTLSTDRAVAVFNPRSGLLVQEITPPTPPRANTVFGMSLAGVSPWETGMGASTLSIGSPWAQMTDCPQAEGRMWIFDLPAFNKARDWNVYR